MSGGTSPIRILAVDDHQLVRDGIAQIAQHVSDETLTPAEVVVLRLIEL